MVHDVVIIQIRNFLLSETSVYIQIVTLKKSIILFCLCRCRDEDRLYRSHKHYCKFC